MKSYNKPENTAKNINLLKNSINSQTSLSSKIISSSESCLTKKTNSKESRKLEKQLAVFLKKASQEKKYEKSNKEEWREAIRRFELIFFLIFLIVFFILPLAIFGEFFFRDLSKSKFNSCSCNS